MGKAEEPPLCGMKFRRQYGVDPYIIDFFCPELKLAIEVDGPIHLHPEERKYDEERQRYIEGFGIRFLRFTNQEVYKEMDGVVKTISRTIAELKAR